MKTRRTSTCRSRKDVRGRRAGLASRSAFTMIEAMVGMVLVGVTLTGVFAVLGRSFDLIEESRDSTRVAQIIQSELEDLRTLSWSEVAALEETSPWYVYVPSSSFTEEFGNRYRVHRYIFEKGTDQFGLRVYVSWTSGSGQWKYDYFETWYTEGGFNDYYYRSF